MKRTLKGLLCTMLVILILSNFIFPSKSYATDGNSPTVAEGIGIAVDGVAGILLMPAKIILLTVGAIGNALISETAEIDATKAGSSWSMSLEDIFFHNVDNKFPILNINFFKSASEINANSNGVIAGIRENIAGWYYAIRNLAIIISLLVLLYIGIRMAISTLAEDKAKYKEFLKDWIVGFIIIFLLHYIIIATINVNEALVTVLHNANGKSVGSGNVASGIFDDYMTQIAMESLSSATFTTGMASAIIYVFMSVLILVFLFSYIKRMLTVAFLILIAPIITITYSIDRIGDRKISSTKYMVKGIYV